MKHAEVNIAGMKIPLIGIPEDATQEKCDRCGKRVHIQRIKIIGTQFVCDKCQESENE